VSSTHGGPTNPSAEATRPRTAELTTGVLLTVAYDGQNYCGFVRQSNGPSVAEELDRAIGTIDPAATLVKGASRTDAGVHARAQAVSFSTRRVIAARGWVLALNQQLPQDIAVVRAAQVPLGYDARRHALWKRYRYLLHLAPVPDPFLAGRAWRIGYPLDLERMAREARSLVGTHDFAAFRSSADRRETTVRELTEVDVRPSDHGPRCLEIVVTGNRFLHNMVRIIVGTLVDVGRGQLAAGAMQRALHSRRREDLGMTAPASGLYLDHLELDDRGSDAWPG
jgi:tRNA pseudouridine38-40 synthase